MPRGTQKQQGGPSPKRSATERNTHGHRFFVVSPQSASAGYYPAAAAAEPQPRLQPQIALSEDGYHLSAANVDLSGDQGAAELQKALDKTSDELLSISLRNCHLDGKGMAVILDAVVKRQWLDTVDLTGNDLDDAAVIALAEKLPHLSILHLVLASNRIGDTGAIAIAQGMTKIVRRESICKPGTYVNLQSNLTTLDMSNNQIGSEGGLALMKATCKRGDMSDLLLEYNDIHLLAGNQLKDMALEYGKALHLAGNPCTTEEDEASQSSDESGDETAPAASSSSAPAP